MPRDGNKKWSERCDTKRSERGERPQEPTERKPRFWQKLHRYGAESALAADRQLFCMTVGGQACFLTHPAPTPSQRRFFSSLFHPFSTTIAAFSADISPCRPARIARACCPHPRTPHPKPIRVPSNHPPLFNGGLPSRSQAFPPPLRRFAAVEPAPPQQDQA